ncbi:NAD(P)/FAD-dependent oxidoreductase [Brevibacillus choshinensis]|uniref:FAD-binding oxidoreductase n=1 Tax=Brevibacillus choshinensis TaxID=54911 RepID=A0ABX7FUS7_BRECH|nr:FAD-dependent oxidoreductase [Brevibacillus choshinensis]QRG69988.1 FAD-binding oxidoreductase [Brevibacillus choshinensis]
MNIVSGKLYWPETLPNPKRYPELTEDIVCDVAIIGGGEAGALCSYYLMQHDIDLVLVDKKLIGEGSSSANTGLLQYANDKSLTACIHSFGEDKGTRFYQMCKHAVDELERISYSIDVFPDYIRRDCLYYASQLEDVQGLQREYENLKKQGFPVTYLEQAQVERRFSFSKPGAIYSTGVDAEINPYKLANGIIQTAARRGMRVYNDTQIVHHKQESGDMVLLTKKGYKIRCKRAVFATGYETQSMKRNPNAVLSTSSAIVTNPVEAFLGWPGACLIWETARPYLFIRTSREGRMIVGGLDEATTDPKKRDASLPGKRDQLLAKIQELFPHIPLRAEYYWSAMFGSTHDGLPLIGEQTDYPGCLFTLGYGGNGTVYATIGGQIITELIVKGNHPDADLFSFQRKEHATIS